jgi:Rieske Fe-S protein
MNRKEFLKICGSSCFGFIGMPMVLQGCGGSMYYAEGEMRDNVLQVNKSAFAGEDGMRESILVKFASSNFPIVVYRFSESEYSALLLQCSHRGTELNVNGNLLSCNAHGSEFDNKGNVLNGPAELPLLSFPVTTNNEYIYIQLD